jgi:hypothetical protein
MKQNQRPGPMGAVEPVKGKIHVERHRHTQVEVRAPKLLHVAPSLTFQMLYTLPTEYIHTAYIFFV